MAKIHRILCSSLLTFSLLMQSQQDETLPVISTATHGYFFLQIIYISSPERLKLLNSKSQNTGIIHYKEMFASHLNTLITKHAYHYDWLPTLSHVTTCEVPRTHTSLGDQSFTVDGPRLCINLPLHLYVILNSPYWYYFSNCCFYIKL